MKKRVLFFPALIGIVFLLGTCENILSPSKDGGTIPPGKGRLAVSLENPRTALPTDPFDSYVLRFVYGGVQGYTHEDEDWNNGLTVDLEPGNWTVYLDAYTGEVVSGTGSAAVTVSAGTVTPVTIIIGMHTGAGVKGTLKYKVSYPPTDADHAYGGTQTLTVSEADGTPVGNPVTITNGAWGTPLALDPGVYFVSVVIEDTIQRTGVARTSVAHIYGGKETPLEFTITEDEFTALVPIVVTADLTVPGDVTVGRRQVSAYGDALCTSTSYLGTVVATDMTGPVELILWAPSTSTAVYVRQEITIVGATPTLEGQSATVNITDPEQGGNANLNDVAKRVNIAAGITNGIVAAVPAAFQGNTVVVTVTPDAGFALRSGTLKFNDGTNDIILTEGPPYRFSMPIAEVTVSAEFVDYGFRYVTATAQGTGDGTSWTNASGDVQKMMDELAVLAAAANPEYTGDYIVKLGEGTYKPQYEPVIPVPGTYASTPSRTNAFILREGVQVWGGYPAAGGNDASRDATHVTTLSGDFSGNDTVTGSGSGLAITNNNENAYHVVVALGLSATALDRLTIKGGNADSTSAFSVGTFSIEDWNCGGGGMYIADVGSLTLNNVTISGNAASNRGGGIYNSGSSITLTDTTISQNYANDGGGGIYSEGELSLVLTGGAISNNYAGADGGGMYNDYGPSPTLTDVTVSGNYAAGAGGGIFSIAGVGTSFTMTLTTVNISDNEAAGGNGGGIYSESDSDDPSTLTMTGGGTISGNEASGYGGGIHNMNASLVKNGGEISDNIAGRSGGGIYNMSDSDDPCTLTLTDVDILDNGASVSGGGIFNDYSSLVMNGGEISGNEAASNIPNSGYGGGIYNTNSSLTLAAVDITDNTASGSATAANSGYGGGIYSLVSSLTLFAVNITGNTATGSATNSGRGGGMYNKWVESLVMNGGEISDNDADGNGGGMYNDQVESLVMNGGEISDNEAAGEGGGMYNDNSSPVLTNVIISGNSAAIFGGGGGGMYNLDSSPVLINVTISGNSATDGTGMGGGMYNDSSSPALTNVTISGNSAGDTSGTGGMGGGMYNKNSSSPALTNVTISGNSAEGFYGIGGGIYNDSSSSPQAMNSIIWGNTANSGAGVENDSGATPTFAYSIVQDSFTSGAWDNTAGTELVGGTNKDEDPLFVDPGTTAPTTGGNYQLQDSPTISPAINAGLDNLYPDGDDPVFTSIITDLDVLDAIAAALEKDRAGKDRFNGVIDMGAYEKE